MKNKEALQNRTSLAERLSYGAYFIGQGFIYTMVSSYLMFYYTEYVHLPVAVITAILVVGKVWDAINDTLFGMIVDKVRFKSGNRFKPWLNLSTLLLPLGTLLVFTVSDAMPMGLRITYALATYVIWDLLYTMCDVPIFSLVTTMTDNIKERSSILTIASMGGAVATGATTIFLVPFFDKHGFLLTAVLVAAIALVTMRFVCHTSKERFKPDESVQQAASLRDTFRYLKGNKYLLYFVVYRLISGSMYIQVMLYVAKYCVGDVKFTSLVMVCAVPITIVLYICAPFILKRFNKITIYRFCMIVFIAAYSILYFVGWQNKVVMIIFLLLALESAIIPGILMTAIPADCVEYGTFKTGTRKEGITFALQTFTSKFCAACATGITGVLLGAIGYTSEAETVVMTLQMQEGLWAGMCWIPVVGQLIALPFLFLYRLKDKDVQVMADANCGKITHEEAEALLSRQY